MAEVRPAVEAAYRQEKAKDLARSAGMQILAEARQGKDLSSLAQQRSLATGETGLFSRSRTFFVPMVGTNEELSNAAFTLTPAAPVPDKVFTVEGALAVVQLKERQNADPAGLTTAVREEMSKAVVDRKKQEILEKALTELRAKAEFKYSAIVAAEQKG
jgi:peptidyl-prolyl cis-trans isomerase D